MSAFQNLVDTLKVRLIEEKYIVIPSSSKSDLTMRMAQAYLREEENYTIHYVQVMDEGIPKVAKILASPGVKYSEIYENLSEIDRIQKGTS